MSHRRLLAGLLCVASVLAAQADDPEKGGTQKRRALRAGDVFNVRNPVMFRDDFQAVTEPLKLWNYSEDDRYRLATANPERIRVVDAPGLDAGRKAVRFVVRRAPNVFRSEISLPHEDGFQDRWYAGRVLIPMEWEFDPTSARDIVMQWHAIPGTWRPTFPNLDISVKNDRWCVAQSFGDPKSEPSRRMMALDEPVKRGEWVSWVVHAKWSPEADGLLRVWKDGKLVIDRAGPNVYGTIGVEYTPYLKTGIYHPAWHLRDTAARESFDREKPVATTKVIYVTDVKVGNEHANYDIIKSSRDK